MIKIAIFASGNGSNAEHIARYFKENPTTQVGLIVCNNPTAYVLERAEALNIPTHLINRKDFYHTETLLEVLQRYHIDFVVLAGFMWLVPGYLVSAFERRLVNIHPALLPKYGGKGMYGDRVHDAVKLAGEKETGITIHYVNERYDEGGIIFQATCAITPQDTAKKIASRVHSLEYKYYPQVIEREIKKSFEID